MDACSFAALEDVVAAILALRSAGADDPWLSKAIETLETGSPGSARIAWEMQERARLLSLADVFRLEYPRVAPLRGARRLRGGDPSPTHRQGPETGLATVDTDPCLV